MKTKEDWGFFKLFVFTIIFSVAFVFITLIIFPEKSPPRPPNGSILEFLNPDLTAR